MPLFYYLCSCSAGSTKFYRKASEAPKIVSCVACGKEQRKQLSAPNSLSTILIDNGVQARSVEVNPNIIEINEERSSRDFSES